jgi:hypothetical protein
VGGSHKRLKLINGCSTAPVWIQYLESGSSSGGTFGGAPNRVKLAALNNFVEFNIPDKGISGVRFWPGYGCDANGANCAVGASGGPASLGFTCPPAPAGCGPPIDSKFEASFGCLPPLTGSQCQSNPSAPGTYLGSLDWWNTSMVDGYTVGVKVQVTGNCPAGMQADGPGGPPGGVIDCMNVKWSDCPTTENLNPYAMMGNNAAYPNYPEYNNLNLLLKHPNTGATAGCWSPASKLTTSQWNTGFTVYPPADTHSQWFACPTPPISVDQCHNGPAPKSKFRANVHAKCNTYTYAYDDGVGLLTCPGNAATTYTVTFGCPQ